MREDTRRPSSPLLAEGRTAEVFLWDDRHILKLYRDWCPPDWVDYEARIARAVFEAGVPSPEAGRIVEVDGRRGLIYERLEGMSMLQEMSARPWTLLRHARSLAELQAEIHRLSIPGLPAYQDRLAYDIRSTPHLDDPLKEKTLTGLSALPGGEALCHGDYHPGNILLTARGPVVIDWMTASRGSPWTDVARTRLLLSVGPRANRQVTPLIRLLVDLYHRAYLKRYLGLRPDPASEAQRWMPVIAAARLSENIIPERETLIRMVEEGLRE